MPTTAARSRPETRPPDARARARRVRQRLLKWYDEHQRRLPWRARPGQAPDPYRVLVSEAMLQQTQVATVLPYFDRFIDALPTVRDLADADEQAVLRLWQGLGYYRRARNLHAAAKAIVLTHGGQVPDRVDQLLKLPGVGRYTAGAVASIAFDKPAPILDGNVARVLARLFLIEQPVDAPDVRKTLWRLAEELVPSARPGDFNQAVMELGALVCTKAGPTCSACPLATVCDALRADRVSSVPVPARRKAPVAVQHHILAIERNGRFLFEQRPADGLWSNMWQMPTAENLSLRADAHGLTGWATRRLNLVLNVPKRLGSFTHQTTHRTIRFRVWLSTATSGRLRPRAGRWRGLGGVDDLPFANPQLRAVGMLKDHLTHRRG
jgi:A/G-specific adenine glycosylase